MKLRRLIFSVFTLGLLVVSCNKDDDNKVTFVERTRAEVYLEDINEIRTFLQTHTFNIAEFLANSKYSDTSVSPVVNDENDSFVLKFTKITDPLTETSLWDMQNPANVNDPTLKSKIIFDSVGQGYEFYYLVVREGLGANLHTLDNAVVRYNGTPINNATTGIEEGESFDGSPLPVSFPLTSLGDSAGVVQGFRDGLIEFKTSVSFTEATNGEITYHNHGIGALFLPSGLGYFSQTLNTLTAYTPLIFKTDLINRVDTDYDLDNIPSHLEDLNGDNNGFNEDTDLDNLNNFFDNDDDNDGILTRDEDLEDTDLNFDSNGDGDPTNDKNGDGNPLNDDTDGDGIPNYLDADTTLERE